MEGGTDAPTPRRDRHYRAGDAQRVHVVRVRE